MWHGLEALDLSTNAPLPRYLNLQFFHILYRARRLLASRLPDEIRDMCTMLNEIRRAPGFEDPLFASIRNWEPLNFVGPNGQINEAMPCLSDAGALLHNMEHIDLAKLDNPHKAAWYELFGAMGLSCVDMAIKVEVHREPAAKKFGASAALRNQLVEYAMTGIEAVTIGEAMLRGDKALEAQVDELWAARIRNQGGKGGKARGQRSREIFGQLLHFMEGQRFRSDRQAVHLFLEACDKALLRGFSPDNRVRLLYDMLRKYRKGLLT